MISQGFGGNLGSISTTPQSYVRAYQAGWLGLRPAVWERVLRSHIGVKDDCAVAVVCRWISLIFSVHDCSQSRIG